MINHLNNIVRRILVNPFFGPRCHQAYWYFQQ
uniref:Uncharacterized protein n=1 Tax=Arundo donax TaxID=35708 RepID=A0A0A9G1D0_ARUDO